MSDVDPGLAEVCRREYPRLVGLLALHVGDVPTAEELAQEALLQLCRRWSSVDNPRAWLTVVATNLANSWLRRHLAERRAYGRHGQVPDRTHDPDQAEIVAVREAVAALPRRQRTAVVLRFFEQLSVAETAAVMGCAEGTVKANTHRGIAALRLTGGLLEDTTLDGEVTHAEAD